MGLFGGKKKADAGGHAGTEAPASQRRSVRRVVPGNRAASSRNAPAVQTGGSAVKRNPAPPVNFDDVQLPSPQEANVAVVATVAEVTPSRPPSTRPILSSAAPEFTGDLGQTRVGPSRTGDQVLCDFLTGKAGLLTADQAASVREKASSDGASLDETAVKMGLLTEQQLVDQLSQETWVPHLKLDKYEIRKKALDTINREDALHFCVFPVDKLGSLLTVAMVNPLDTEAIRQLEQKTGLDIKRVVATRSEISQAIDKYYGGKAVALDGTRSFTQDRSELATTPTQSINKAQAMPPLLTPIEPKPAVVPESPPSAIGSIDISADIQDIDDLLGGEESIAPAIIEPISIKPENDNESSELTDALIAPAPTTTRVEAEFSLDDAPHQDASALALHGAPAVKATESAQVQQPGLTANAPVESGMGSRAGLRGARSATSRLVAGNAGPKLSNLVPVLEDEFRYAISHGKAHIFERWVALQSRNRIVNGVAVEKELEGVLSGLYAAAKPHS